MELRNLINKIAQESNVIFRPAEPGDIETLSSLNLPSSVIDFYKRFEPQDCAEIDGVRLWPIKEMLRENTAFVPGADIHKYGYIVFATTDFGDAYCLDTDETNTNSEPPVVLMSHEIYYPEFSVSQIKNIRTKVAESFEDFLQKYATKQLEQEPRYAPE